MSSNIKSKYLSSAFILLVTSVVVKILSAVYKIPLTAFIGATGRGYFAAAYNICMPIHAITMGAFPIALSRLVSSYNSKGDSVMISALKKSAHKLFFVVGIIGMCIMLVFAKPYSNLIANSPDSIYTILVLAPSVLFSCMAASYRGFFEGFLNMVPTGVSQTIEAIFKTIFGLLFAKLSMAYLFNVYLQTGCVLGEQVANDTQALSLIYPYTSAAAMLGVTFGTFASYIYVVVYSKIKFQNKLLVTPQDTKLATKELLSFSFTVMISTAVQSVFQFLDTATVQYSLGNISILNLRLAFDEALKINNVADTDLITYVYGLFSTALDFKNLVPSITMALGVCAVPAVSNAFQNNNIEKLKTLTNSIIKYTTMLSTFSGVFINIESERILNLFYSSTQDVAVGSNQLVKMFGLTVFAYSLAGLSVFCVQAVGLPQKSIAPFIVSGVARVVLNLVLISNEKLILIGAVISGFVGYMIITIWNLRIITKYCNIKISTFQCFIKPILAVILTFVFYKIIISVINFSNYSLITLCVKGIVFALVYVLLSIIFGNLSFSDVFSVIKCKKSGLNT